MFPSCPSLARRHAPENMIRSLEQVPGFGYLFLMITRPDRVCRRPIHENGGAIVVFSASSRSFGSADFNAGVSRHFLLVRSFPWSGESHAGLFVLCKAAEKLQLVRTQYQTRLQRHRPLLSLP